MALKTVLETLDGVDDAVKALYAEVDGKFVLQIEGLEDHPELASLKGAYDRTKKDRETARADTATLRAKIAELEKGAPDTAATQAKMASLQEKLDAAEAKGAELSGKLTGVTRDRALADALQTAGITDPTFIKASQSMLSGMVKMGDDGTAFVETPMGPKLVPDFVKSWAAGDGKVFVAPAQGGGAKGSDSAKSGATMKRAEFDKLPPDQRQKAIATDKVTLVD